MVSVGGKHAIFNAVSVLVQHGDEVILPAPYWVSFPDIIKYAGGTPVIVPTSAADGFSVKAADIEKAITPKTRMVIINSPSNPCGGVVDPPEFEKILALQKAQYWLMGDECYSHFVYEPHKPFSIASARDSKSNVIIIGSVSKTFAMTGWRIGYTLAPEELIQAMIKIQSQSTSNPTSIAQYAALEAMRGTMETVPPCLLNTANAESESWRDCAPFPASPASGRAGRSMRFRIFPRILVMANRRWQKIAPNFPNCYWRNRTWRWWPAKRLARQDF